jgi:hypothetical protein
LQGPSSGERAGGAGQDVLETTPFTLRLPSVKVVKPSRVQDVSGTLWLLKVRVRMSTSVPAFAPVTKFSVPLFTYVADWAKEKYGLTS